MLLASIEKTLSKFLRQVQSRDFLQFQVTQRVLPYYVNHFKQIKLVGLDIAFSRA